MVRIETSLPGVWVLEPAVYRDERGFFLESYHRQRYESLGITACFVQDNHSRSVRNTLRGLHYQINRSQGKLCRAIRGAVLDVAVDIRRNSPYFGKWVSVVLSDDNHRQIWVPRGFAHGFVVLSEEADFSYKCDEFYSPADERGVAWDDPDIGIEWNLQGTPILSKKDERNLRLRNIDPDDLPVFAPDKDSSISLEGSRRA